MPMVKLAGTSKWLIIDNFLTLFVMKQSTFNKACFVITMETTVLLPDYGI